MSYSNSSPENYSSSAAAANSPELKLYQAFIFSVPICFTFIILFLFYLIYLRRGSADLSSLGIRTTILTGNSLSTAELGLSKELREMLPVVVFKESFSVMDSQCSVCLGEYQAEDKLQQIPVCGHTFHMDCIDLWLTSHTTCPLCRLTLIPSQSHQSQQEAEEEEEDPPLQSLSTRDGEVSNQPPESQQENHGNDEQDQQERDPNECDPDGESFKERQEEDERSSIGTSSACCNCRLG
uniref:RING-type E3 ubiquitin transferase n=1 Tax=Noccaea caerulescens TaxID=107243 RepID=A0A1J3EA37_NOCCA